MIQHFAHFLSPDAYTLGGKKGAPVVKNIDLKRPELVLGAIVRSNNDLSGRARDEGNRAGGRDEYVAFRAGTMYETLQPRSPRLTRSPIAKLKVLGQVSDVADSYQKRLGIPARVVLSFRRRIMNAGVLEEEIAKGMDGDAKVEEMVGLVRL